MADIDKATLEAAVIDPPSGGVAYVRADVTPALPPPLTVSGPVAWIRANLLAGVGSTIVMLIFVVILALALPGLIRFLFIDAVWSGDGQTCRANPDGACWAFVATKFQYFMYGAYPDTGHWRVNVVIAMGAVLIVWLLTNRAPGRKYAALLFFIAYPIVSFFLIRGADWLGLEVVDTGRWGGLFLTLLISVVGIVFSLPAGVMLALGRRSKLPIVRAASTTFIEVVRGVPFITVLFMANVMLPLFVPEAWTPDRLLRPLIGTALFSAAYMAENVRGGLQALPKGQSEGAAAVGLGYWQSMRLIILPQALTIVIPGIVSTFISLFKDTSLVAIVGAFDFLLTIESARVDPNWGAPSVPPTGYIFAATVYWVFCFGMSRYSQSVERRLNTGRRH